MLWGVLRLVVCVCLQHVFLSLDVLCTFDFWTCQRMRTLEVVTPKHSPFWGAREKIKDMMEQQVQVCRKSPAWKPKPKKRLAKSGNFILSWCLLVKGSVGEGYTNWIDTIPKPFSQPFHDKRIVLAKNHWQWMDNWNEQLIGSHPLCWQPSEQVATSQDSPAPKEMELRSELVPWSCCVDLGNGNPNRVGM